MAKKIEGQLSPRETSILNILWDAVGPITPLEVIERLNIALVANGEPKVPFGTLDRSLRQLVERKLVASIKPRERVVLYSPLVTREEMAALAMNEISKAILKTPLSAILTRLQGTSMTTPRGQESQEARDLIEQINKLASS